MLVSDTFPRNAVVPPLIMTTAVGYVETATLSLADPSDSIFDYASSWVTVFLVLTLILNMACTGTPQSSGLTGTATFIHEHL